MITPEGKQDKGWGYEIVWASNDKYCGKILVFERPGAKTGMQFHKTKECSLFVNAGQFALRFIDTKTAELKQQNIKEGDTYKVIPMQPYQLISMTPNSIIFEVGTPDDADDIYIVGPGDGLSKTEN
jgi:uncharacterized RmlC-like cupin family protein